MNITGKLLQIGLSTYPIDTDERIIQAIKDVVIYHQGELSTMKIIKTSMLSDAQEAYVSYHMMDAATTTADEDMPAFEEHFVEQAIHMGSKECKEWLEYELE
jgi:hypothetical protein